MILTLSNLPKIVKKNKRIGRGGKYGKNAGHGNKGQNKRGGKRPVAFQGTKSILRQAPKLKGFKAIKDKQLEIVTISFLDKNFKNGEKITLDLLRNCLNPKLKRIRIIKTGDTSKKFSFEEGIYLTEGVKKYFKIVS